MKSHTIHLRWLEPLAPYDPSAERDHFDGRRPKRVLVKVIGE